MATQPDTYRTVKNPSPEVLFKERNSKFYGYALPLNNAQEVEHHLANLRKKHPTAGHFCYAWRLGTSGENYKANDDGEPNNSAGMPIYGQLLAHGVTNILVVVVRIFGGVKLGVGGLIQAYKSAAQLALEASKIKKVYLEEELRITFNYPQMGPVMRIVGKYDLKIEAQQMQDNCLLKVRVKSKHVNVVVAELKAIYPVQVKKVSN